MVSNHKKSNTFFDLRPLSIYNIYIGSLYYNIFIIFPLPDFLFDSFCLFKYLFFSSETAGFAIFLPVLCRWNFCRVCLPSYTFCSLCSLGLEKTRKKSKWIFRDPYEIRQTYKKSCRICFHFSNLMTYCILM